jgi:hypothetical protein
MIVYGWAEAEGAPGTGKPIIMPVFPVAFKAISVSVNRERPNFVGTPCGASPRR